MRPLAATIITYKDNLSVVPMSQTLYAMAAVRAGVDGDALPGGVGSEAAAEALRDSHLMADTHDDLAASTRPRRDTWKVGA